MRASVRMSVTGLMAAVLASSSPARAVPGPWQRTETREPCANFNVLRSPYFGETHVHTAYSVDASIFDVCGTVDGVLGARRQITPMRPEVTLTSQGPKLHLNGEEQPI